MALHPPMYPKYEFCFVLFHLHLWERSDLIEQIKSKHNHPAIVSNSSTSLSDGDIGHELEVESTPGDASCSSDQIIEIE